MVDDRRVAFAPGADAWERYTPYLLEWVVKSGAKDVCEVGGGANPLIPIEFVREHGLDYTIVDISPTELSKAPEGYRTQVLDIAHPGAVGERRFDLVFSKMLAEHVRDARTFHENCFALLKPGGLAVHFFPTLWAPPFVLNVLLPERFGYWLLNLVQRGRQNSGRRGKFPAYYRWCRGPTRRQIARLEGIGFEVVQYLGFFGHPGYYRKFRPLLGLHLKLAALLRARRWAGLTSFAFVVLRRPGGTNSKLLSR